MGLQERPTNYRGTVLSSLCRRVQGSIQAHSDGLHEIQPKRRMGYKVFQKRFIKLAKKHGSQDKLEREFQHSNTQSSKDKKKLAKWFADYAVLFQYDVEE